MLPAFVIGLREGLETVVILGAIALFLQHQGRRDELRHVWIATAAATLITLVLTVVLRLVQVNLSFVAEERFEATVGAVAVLTVTYMVVWMRRFPKDLMRDSSAAAASRLAHGSAKALAAMAFFAVLREGFEISVFLLALIGAHGSDPTLGTAGAVAGVLVAVVVGVAVVRGGVRIDIARFFRATAIILVVTAAGIAMTAVNAANPAGWITFGQTPQFDWSVIAPPGSVLSSITTGMFGIQPYPVLIEVVVWATYLVVMLLVVLWPKRRSVAAERSGEDEVVSATQRLRRPRRVADASSEEEPTPMTELLLVRHAESIWNAEGRFQGRADPPLSPRGLAQVERVAAALPPLQRIASSDLQRARTTAAVLGQHLGISDIELLPALRERDVGAWSGLTNDEIDQRWPGQRAAGLRPEGWETNAAILERVLPALGAIAADASEETVLVVTHGGVITSIEQHLGAEPVHLSNLGGRWLRVRASGALELGDRVTLASGTPDQQRPAASLAPPLE